MKERTPISVRLPRASALRMLWLFVAIFMVVATPLLPVRAAEIEILAFSPTGKIHVSSVRLAWRLRPAKGTQIANISFTLNGSPVPSEYSATESCAFGKLSNALAPGVYTVGCDVECDDGSVFHNDWSFTVLPSAVKELPPPTPAQVRACERANSFRRLAGLPDFHIDSRLCAAAVAHTKYLHRNSVFSHEEQESQAGFIGAHPGDRVVAYGYDNSSFEDLASTTEEFSDTLIDELFHAPYHRVPFLQPGTPDFGVALDQDIAALEFGATGTIQEVHYPVDGQQDVPLVFTNNEQPDPLRIHGVGGETGYVITLFYFTPTDERMTVKSATLTLKDGTPVPCYVNTPANDDALKNGVLIIPKKYLKPLTTYTAAVEATTTSGETISRRWSFTTSAKKAADADDAPEKPAKPAGKVGQSPAKAAGKVAQTPAKPAK
jgi:hypothetical protein